MSKMTFFRRFFGTHFTKKQNLANVNAEQIRKERIRVEQTEIKLTREIEELESKKAELFRKGVEQASDRQRVQVARKIKELDRMVQAKDGQLALLSKNLQVLNSVAQLKDNERLLQDLGMDNIVNNMNLSDVQTYVERATIEGQFQMERFTTLLQSIGDAEGRYDVQDMDAETESILEVMALASRNQSESSIRDGMTQVDQILHKESPTT